MDVDVPLFECLGGYVQRVSVSLDIFHRQHRRFLHHVAQVARQREFAALALAQRGLDKEYFTAHGCPRQSCHHADAVVVLVLLTGEKFGTEQFLDVLGLERFGRFLLFFSRLAQGYLAQHLVDFLVQFAHAAFTGVVLDNFLNGSLRELHVRALHADVFQLFRHEVALGNLQFFLGQVAAHLDEFHAVEQRGRNRTDVVGRGDEHDVRHVVVHIDVVVVESLVLLRVEHFEQGRGRVAMDGILSHLVDFVEDEHGVRRACLLQTLDDAAGHGTDVGAAVSAYFRFVLHTAQTHAHILALHGRGNAASERGLADSRRAVQADDGTFEVATQLQHGEVFENALLYFFHAIVVAVEDALGGFDVDAVLRHFVPRQVEQHVQIVQLSAVFGTLSVLTLKFFHFFVEALLCLFAPFLLGGTFTQFRGFVVVGLAQFLLDVLHLFAEEELALATAQVLVRLHLDVGLELGKLVLAVEDGEEFLSTFGDQGLFEQHDMFLVGDGQAAAHEVDEEDAALQVVERERRFDAHAVASLHELICQVATCLDGGTKLAVAFLGLHFGIALDVSHEVAVGIVRLGQPYAAQSLQEGCLRAVGQFEHLDHTSQHAGAVEVFLGGVFLVLLFLSEDGEGQFAFRRVGEQRLCRFAANIDRQ